LDLVIGRLSGVNPDSIRFAFELLGPGTLMERAEICIREPAAVCACRGCGTRSEIDELVALCPRCASHEVAIEGGQELILQSIEVDP
jgi:hydrogenase nickel incorporation protein HypA/HybF